MSSINDKIKENLVAISEGLNEIPKVLAYLVQENIISVEERDLINTKDAFERNSELFFILHKRNTDLIWERLKKTLLSTGNGRIVELLEANNPTYDAEDTHTMFFGPRLIRLNDFEAFEVIGSGGFGTVMKARLKRNKNKYAIKITKKHSHREINSLVKSKHQNIVNCESAWCETINEDSLQLNEHFADYIGLKIYCIQMELCNGRNLSAWIEKPPHLKTKYGAQRICYQISLGVQSLHTNKIIHRDLKPANILLVNIYQKGDEQNIIVKIGDLGLSKQTYLESKADRKSFMTNCGTENYKSPEQDTEKDYDLLTDVFSMGVIFFEVLNSTIVTKAPINYHFIRKALLPDNFVEAFKSEKNLIEAMLSYDAGSRPNANDVVYKLKTLWGEIVTKESTPVTHNTVSNSLKTDEMYCNAATVTSKGRETVHSDTSGGYKSCGEDSLSLSDSSFQRYNDSLEKYSTENGVFYLRNKLANSVLYTNEQLNELAKILQNNRVALQVAYLTLNKRRCSMKVYLDRFKLVKHKIHEEGDLLQITYPPDFFWEVLECLENLSVPSYSADCKDNQITLKIDNKKSLNELIIKFQKHEQLGSVFFKNMNIPKNIAIVNIEYENDGIGTHTPEFPINFLFSKAEQITLTNCTVIGDGKIRPRELSLVNIKVVQNENHLESFDLSDFVNFEQISKLSVHDNLGKTKLIVDLCKLNSLDVLDVNCSKLLNWGISTCNINKLTLHNFQLEQKTKMTIRELHVLSTVNPLFIPHSVEKLYIEDCTSNSKSGNSRVDLSNLKYLSIWCNQIANFTDLASCPNLETLVVSLSNTCHNLMVHKAPSLELKKVSRVRLDTIPIKFDGTQNLDVLILYSYDWKNANLVLEQFAASHLVLRFDQSIKSEKVDKVVQLLSAYLLENFNKRRTISIGKFDLTEEEFAESKLKSYVEKNAGFYNFRRNSGTALNEEEFESMCNL